MQSALAVWSSRAFAMHSKIKENREVGPRNPKNFPDATLEGREHSVCSIIAMCCTTCVRRECRRRLQLRCCWPRCVHWRSTCRASAGHGRAAQQQERLRASAARERRERFGVQQSLVGVFGQFHADFFQLQLDFLLQNTCKTTCLAGKIACGALKSACGGLKKT